MASLVPLLDHLARTAAARVGSTWLAARHRLGSDDRGEGVISAAIVVLIMAFLGVAMWAAFNVLFDGAAQKTSSQVDLIGGT